VIVGRLAYGCGAVRVGVAGAFRNTWSILGLALAGPPFYYFCPNYDDSTPSS
jgi:hypothetical protein